MSTAILSSIRKLPQLKGSLLLTAQEIAHRADGNSGIVRISYSLIAAKAHCSIRTAIRHVKRLIALKIIRCQRFRGPNRKWGINAYSFCIFWDKPSARPSNTDKMTEILPTLREGNETEKFTSLEQEARGRKFVLESLTPGSALWKLAMSFE
jgi:hypothetical protein